ncbi:MAG: Rrf2 family transcriptional regulator [Oscillospiraceae bacterium]|nr:Rrf2 family transcriptional regulator [Oscillospiraceae bacterium]
MLLTKECDYGVRTIRALSSGEKKTVADICEVEWVPVPYAYKILKKLEHAGLVQSLRGREGGYQLTQSLDQFSLYDIVAAIDKNLLIFECLGDNSRCPFRRGEQPCAIHAEFERLQAALVAELQAKTMQEVLNGGNEPL